MRDGMPGPGWWIASDGRWYPPELHPDVRAWAKKVIVEDAPPPTSPPPPPISMPPSSLDTSHAVSSPSVSSPRVPAPGLSNGKAAFLDSLRSSNGTQVATRDRAGTTDAAREPLVRAANVSSSVPGWRWAHSSSSCTSPGDTTFARRSTPARRQRHRRR